MLYINFAIAFGYYGLWLWFPTLFDKLNKYYSAHPNATVSVCEITDYKGTTVTAADNFCGPKPDSTVFTNSIYISLAAAPANIWTVFHMDKLGRKFFLGNQKTEQICKVRFKGIRFDGKYRFSELKCWL